MQNSPFFSIVVCSFMGEYPGCATDRQNKFIRCLQSARKQIFSSYEIVVVSDGCFATNEIIESAYPEVKLIKTHKHSIFEGSLRQIGIDNASGEYIVWLDTDDFISDDHLLKLNQQILFYKNPDMVFYDTYLFNPVNENEYFQKEKKVLTTRLRCGEIGNGMFSFKRKLEVSYVGCDGYNQDWQFVERLKKATKSIEKINRSGYFVCHIPQKIDS